MNLQDDERVQAALRDEGPFHHLEHHAQVGSTNDVALEALHQGGSMGLVVVADRQTAGRGRAGQPWTDDVSGPHGPGNLAVTATLSAPDGPVGLVPLAAGLAVVEVFESFGAAAELKWPNDVLLAGRKAAGILVESHRIDGVDVLLVGCGLDLDWRGVAREPDTADWVSLAEVTGRSVDRAAALAALLRSLTRRLEEVTSDADWLRHDYVHSCATIGSWIRARLPDGDGLEGRAIGIEDDGRLKVETTTATVAVSAAEISYLRSS